MNDAVSQFAREEGIRAGKPDFRLRRLGGDSGAGGFPSATVIGTGGDAGGAAG
jgi:hypothetical protein